MSSPPAPGAVGPTSSSVALTSLALRRNFFREAARAMSSTAVVPSAAGPGPGPSGGPGGGTEVIQVTNVSPSASSEQMRTLFGFLGKIDELRLFPPDDSPLPVSSRVCFVKFHDPDSAVVAQHLTNTVFVDRALIVVPYAEGVIPDETKALSLLAPANAVAGLLPGGGLLPTPNPLTQIGAVPLAALGAPALDPALAALGLPGTNLNSQSLAADQLLKLMSTVDPKLNHVAAGLVSPSLKSDTSSKEIEEAMKRVREAQSLISAAIEPDKKEEKRRHSRSRSRSRRRRTPSSSRHRRSRSRSRRRSHSKSRSRRRSKSPRRRRSHSRERGRRSRSTSKARDKKKEDKEKKRSKTPPKSYSTARRSRSASRHKKEKKKDKDKERSRDERERSTSKKKRSKDKEKERERKSESDKDVKQVTRDYDEEEQGYDSEKEKKEEKRPTEAVSPKTKECSVEKGVGDLRESKVNGDDHHEEDMDMSD
ncbi:serine/arginine-rich splicing factor 11 isoform X5 [Cricetulus griseus]|uniref:Serine/arginine-rich splicing factor 11 isoform X11 n=1 Tax=Cricetulus griseus TaxID=10029 RepID=A0A9J7HAC6_CRIGR|nr:serine/arginine-rich splicing factor 11 isoform X11 [Cricetulus griseus]XP_035311039.1 serine/arginine-rich splicing factor 11 isoform X5 [Cricetulus griseus]